MKNHFLQIQFGHFGFLFFRSYQKKRETKQIVNISNMLMNLHPIWHGFFWTVSHGGHDCFRCSNDHEIWHKDEVHVFYTMVTKKFVTSLLSSNHDVITCILTDV